MDEGDNDVLDKCRDMELVHSADVMVGAHGAGLKNYIFMRADTAFIELIPQGFYRLREGHEWSLFIPATTQAMDNVVRHYAINVEDPAMSDPSSFEKEGWVWTSVFGPPHKERNMRLPWTMLKQVLDVIRTSDRDAYLRLRRDGDNVFDLLPGGVLQRTPVPNECYGIKRLDEGKDLGKQALDSIEQLQEDSTNTREVFQRALELATNGVLGTQDAVNVLNNRKDGGAKTNETLIELLVAQNAQNKQILSTVENAIRKAGLTELLPQSPPPPGQEAGALSA